MKTAVILVARKERDSKVPYPLIPFHDHECLIDRTLSILKELSYEHIYIVCGYRSELFDQWNNEHIKVLYNKDFAYTGSMASLSMVKDYVNDDFLLLEGDNFYERKVIEELSSTNYPDCLAITEESGSGNEAFVETRKGFVLKISKDKHQIAHYSGEMLGIMRISLYTFNKMLQCWTQSNNLLLNYEYVFCDVTSVLDRPYIYFKNLIWGNINTKEDFHKLKNYIYVNLRCKENPYDHDNLISHLKTIFPERTVNDSKISQIGGLSNKNFKVRLDNDTYVLRIPGFGANGMIDRSLEEENSAKASQLGINPPLRYFNKKTGIKLVDFVSGAETLNAGTIQRQENLSQVAQILSKLHNSQIRFNNDFNVFREIVKYEDLLENVKGKMYEGYEEIRDKVFNLENLLNKYGVNLKPCHNDMVAENFIKSDSGQIYLIDWEYSGINDPFWEFAALFLENNFSKESKDFFLNEYFGRVIPAHTQEKIFIYMILQDILWSIWTRIKEAAGDDFATYGIDRFTRGVNNLGKIL